MSHARHRDRARRGSPASATPRTRYVWNVRLLVATVLLGGAVLISGFFWLRYQERRTATVLLNRADRFEQEEDWSQASAYVLQFVGLRRGTPEADQALVRFAHLVDKGADDLRGKSQAVRAYYRALGNAPDAEKPAMLRRVVQLLLDLGRFAEAESEATALLAKVDKDAVGLRGLALALYGQVDQGVLNGRHDPDLSVGGELQKAIVANPGDLDVTYALATVFRRYPSLLNDLQRREFDSIESRHQRADQLFADAVRLGADDPQAWLARYQYRKQNNLEGADSDLDSALNTGPDDLAVRLTAAADARSRDDAELRAKAVDHYEHILQHIDAESELAYVGLGRYYLGEQKLDKALEVWRRGLSELGDDHWGLNIEIAVALLRASRWDAAEQQINVISQLSSGKLGDKQRRLDPQIQREREEVRDLMRATLWINRGQEDGDHSSIQRALAVLERLRQVTKIRGEVLQLLGQAYGSLRQWDAAAKAYDEVVKLDAKRLSARAAAAAAWLAGGQIEEAEMRYESLTAATDSPEAWLALAVTRLQQQARRTPAERNWNSFAAAGARLETLANEGKLSNAWRLALVRGDHLYLTDSSEASIVKARALLAEAEREYPDSLGLFSRLVSAYERLGDAAGADRALERMSELGAPAEQIVLTRALMQSSRRRYGEAEATLHDGLKNLPKRYHGQLRTELVRLALAQAKPADARALLEEQAVEGVANVDELFQLGELLLSERHFPEVERQIERLRDIEGPTGVRWKMLQARATLLKAKGKDDPMIADAARVLRGVLASRPKWSAAQTLAGALADLQQDRAAAAAAYGRAVELGERNTAVIRRLFELLKDRVGESEKYVALLNDTGSLSSELAGMQISLAEQRGRHDQAVALARAEVQRKPDDVNAQSWLGRVLLNSYHADDPNAEAVRQEALAALSKARELDPKSTQTWNNLFVYHLVTGQSETARRMVDEIDEFPDLSATKRLGLKSQCWMKLGDPAKARELLQQAVKAEPTSPSLRVQLAEVLVRDDVAAATEELREALRLDPKADQVRRNLAALLVAQGGADRWNDAQTLLEGGEDSPENDANQRLKAQAYVVRRGSDNLRKAREILERLKNSPTGTPNDQLLLAQVYELSGMDSLARDEYRAVAARKDAPSAHLMQFVDYLLRHEQWNDATPWLSQLETKEPNSLIGLRLKARWLKGAGRETDIDAAIEQVAGRLEMTAANDAARAKLYRELGELATQVGRYVVAESWYRKAVTLTGDQFVGLAYALAQQGRRAEALEVCTAAAEKDSTSRPAIVACETLLVGQPTPAEFALAEPLIARALEAHPNDVQLLGSIANVRYSQLRRDEAFELFRKVVRLEPRDLISLNNLATLLGEQPGRADEALGYVEEAIKHGGQQPTFLDTKGTILIYQGKAKAAVPLLETAARALSPDPRYYFHLAVAYAQTEQLGRARAALKKSLDLGLKQHVLTEGDRQLWSELDRKLAEDGSS